MADNGLGQVVSALYWDVSSSTIADWSAGIVVCLYDSHCTIRRYAHVCSMESFRKTGDRGLPYRAGTMLSHWRSGHSATHVDLGSRRHVESDIRQVQRDHADDCAWIHSLRILTLGGQIRPGPLLQTPRRSRVAAADHLQRCAWWFDCYLPYDLLPHLVPMLPLRQALVV